MRAYAGVVADSLDDERGLPHTRISWMRSQAPLMFRTTRESLPACLDLWNVDAHRVASVRLAAGAAGPLGGDHLRIDVRVRELATLIVSAVSASLILPGPHGEESRSEVNISVATGGTLVWVPGKQIAASGCRHASVTRIDLEPGARLYVREELLLGRENELPGSFRQRLRVTEGGNVVYDQEVALGVPGWQSSAVTGGRRALGSIMVIDPVAENIAAFTTSVSGQLPDTATMRLGERSALVASAAADSIALDRRLTAAFAKFTVAPTESARSAAAFPE